MAPSYDPQDALNAITPQLGNVTLDTTASGIVANEAQMLLWNYAPWRWERKVSTSLFTVVDDTQDYTAGVPSDFMQLLEAELVRTDTTPDEVTHLDIKNYVYTDQSTKNFPIGEIAYLQELNSGAGGFRIPNPLIGSGVTAIVRGVYRKTPATKYTSANLTTDFVELPDQFFYLYKEWLLYAILRFVGDSRAGTATFQNGRWAFTGQLAIANAFSEQALQAEDYGDTQTVAPSESLTHEYPARRLFP